MNRHGTSRPGTTGELDIRSLRYFIAAAEELHFTRAAARLFVAQQALSRDIARLERLLGVPLFVRTTRRVTLTPEGRRFLERARELVALHDVAIRELREPARPLVVDLLSGGRQTGARILQAAREATPDLEFRSLHGGGVGGVLSAVLGGEVDVAFGRADGLGQELPAELGRVLVRLEALAVLVPDGHPFAARDRVPLGDLRDAEIDTGAGNIRAPEWIDLAEQLVAFCSARATPPHVPAVGLEEQAIHLVRQGLPILTSADHVAVPGGRIVPLVEPVPLYPWSMIHRQDVHPPALAALEAAAAEIGVRERWLELPVDHWLPQPEASRVRSQLEAARTAAAHEAGRTERRA